jgi:aspartyl-tRNA(Asn)/glutamyl-tRNA(Gln) amidotransferase subunit A
MINLKELTIKKAHDALIKKEYTAVMLAQEYLKEIENKNPELHAYLGIYDDVIEQAQKADEMFANGKATMVTGIPFAIKDNILFEGKVASGGSKILENYVATYDATVIKKLKEAGAVILGRANMDEFAMGGSTENSAYGPSKNPNDTTRVPGGSSGGSAVTVAGGMALVALGSDTGGSIRQPASFCGIVGLKPTYGSVSRHGLMSMASSLDVIGPMTKTVEDAEIVYNVIKGKDEFDATSVEGEINKKGKYIIGIPKDFLKDGVDADVLENFNQSVEKLKSQGFEIKDVSLPTLPYALAVYYILMPAEVSSNLARLDGVKYGSLKEGKDLIEDYFLTRGEFFGKEARRRIMLGTYVLSTGYYDAYYGKALKVRELVKQDFDRVFKEVDVIITPVSPMPAFKFGEKANDPLQMYLADIFTVGANLATVPAISIPAGVVSREEKSLPVGLQIIAPRFGENILFEIGKKFENSY